jgi:hypothetical protein
VGTGLAAGTRASLVGEGTGAGKPGAVGVADAHGLPGWPACAAGTGAGVQVPRAGGTRVGTGTGVEPPPALAADATGLGAVGPAEGVAAPGAAEDEAGAAVGWAAGVDTAVPSGAEALAVRDAADEA